MMYNITCIRLLRKDICNISVKEFWDTDFSPCLKRDHIPTPSWTPASSSHTISTTDLETETTTYSDTTTYTDLETTTTTTSTIMKIDDNTEPHPTPPVVREDHYYSLEKSDNYWKFIKDGITLAEIIDDDDMFSIDVGIWSVFWCYSTVEDGVKCYLGGHTLFTSHNNRSIYINTQILLEKISDTRWKTSATWTHDYTADEFIIYPLNMSGITPEHSFYITPSYNSDTYEAHVITNTSEKSWYFNFTHTVPVIEISEDGICKPFKLVDERPQINSTTYYETDCFYFRVWASENEIKNTNSIQKVELKSGEYVSRIGNNNSTIQSRQVCIHKNGYRPAIIMTLLNNTNNIYLHSDTEYKIEILNSDLETIAWISKNIVCLDNGYGFKTDRKCCINRIIKIGPRLNITVNAVRLARYYTRQIDRGEFITISTDSGRVKVRRNTEYPINASCFDGSDFVEVSANYYCSTGSSLRLDLITIPMTYIVRGSALYDEMLNEWWGLFSGYPDTISISSDDGRFFIMTGKRFMYRHKDGRCEYLYNGDKILI